MMSSSSRWHSCSLLSSGLQHLQVGQCGQFLLLAIFSKAFDHRTLATSRQRCKSLFNLTPMRPYGAQLVSKKVQSLAQHQLLRQHRLWQTSLRPRLVRHWRFAKLLNLWAKNSASHLIHQCLLLHQCLVSSLEISWVGQFAQEGKNNGYVTHQFYSWGQVSLWGLSS